MDHVEKPDDGLWITDFAALAGVASATLRGYMRKDRRSRMGVNPFPSPSGRAMCVSGSGKREERPWWSREVAEAWIAGRPGSPGREPGVRPRRPGQA